MIVYDRGVHLQSDFMDIKGHNFTGGCTPEGLRTKATYFKQWHMNSILSINITMKNIKKGTQRWNFTIETAIKR